MNNHKDDLAPERIGLISDPLGAGLWALATKDEAGIAIHYTRADLAQSTIKAAAAAALMKAAEVCAAHEKHADFKSVEAGGAWWDGYANGAYKSKKAILDMITPDQSILDAYVKAKVEEALMDERARLQSMHMDHDAYFEIFQRALEAGLIRPDEWDWGDKQND